MLCVSCGSRNSGVHPRRPELYMCQACGHCWDRERPEESVGDEENVFPVEQLDEVPDVVPENVLKRALKPRKGGKR